MGLLGSLGDFLAPVAKYATGGLINPKNTLNNIKESGIGDYIPGIGDAKAQEEANRINLEMDKMNREWMERMSNSAYQRAMPDMRAAGLNPMLAFQQGGASVPNTSAPTVSAAPKTGLASAAVQAYTGIGGLNVQKAQAATAQAAQASTASLQTAQTAETMASTAKAQAETAEVSERIKNHKLDRYLKQNTQQIELLKNRAGKIGNTAIDIIGDWVKGEGPKIITEANANYKKGIKAGKEYLVNSAKKFKEFTKKPEVNSHNYYQNSGHTYRTYKPTKLN